MYGNSFESFLVAVVVPDQRSLEDWAVDNKQVVDFKVLCENLKARKHILDELNNTGREQNVRCQIIFRQFPDRLSILLSVFSPSNITDRFCS